MPRTTARVIAALATLAFALGAERAVADRVVSSCYRGTPLANTGVAAPKRDVVLLVDRAVRLSPARRKKAVQSVRDLATPGTRLRVAAFPGRDGAPVTILLRAHVDAVPGKAADRERLGEAGATGFWRCLERQTKAARRYAAHAVGDTLRDEASARTGVPAAAAIRRVSRRSAWRAPAGHRHLVLISDLTPRGIVAAGGSADAAPADLDGVRVHVMNPGVLGKPPRAWYRAIRLLRRFVRAGGGRLAANGTAAMPDGALSMR